MIKLRFEKAFTCRGSCFAAAAVSKAVRKYSRDRFAHDFWRFCVLTGIFPVEKNKVVKRERCPGRPWGVLEGFVQGAEGCKGKGL